MAAALSALRASLPCSTSGRSLAAAALHSTIQIFSRRYGRQIRCLNNARSSVQRNSKLAAATEDITAQRSTDVSALQLDAAPPNGVLATAHEDTIASVVTGPTAQGAVAIIRISGSQAVDVAQRLFWPNGRFEFDWRPKSHRIYYGTVVDGDGTAIDEVLLLPMLSPRSYTREDVVELHCHGGGVCARRVLQVTIESGARPARPGEFTLRAFLNGRLDLSQAESILQLVQARTPAAADSALAGLQGGIGAAVSGVRARAIELLGELEARLDFEEDMPLADVTDMAQQVASMQEDIEQALRTARSGTLLRAGLQVAIVGRPNVGKSSLLNAWSNSNRAIVTDIAGTTRDVLEAGLVVGGVPITLLDTAGIRTSADTVERIGVERSREAAVGADVVVMVVDASAGWTQEDGEIFNALWGNGPGSRTCRVKGLGLLVANKADLPGAKAPSLPLLAREAFQAIVSTSALTRGGMDELEAALLRLAGAPELAAGGVSWAVNERQAEALVRAHEALMRCGQAMADQAPMDCWTIDLRGAILSLGEVCGEEVTEEVLDNVFSRFCIGK